MALDGDDVTPCSGLHFLVVEDHAFQRRVLAQLLHRMGAAAVHDAEDGEAALALLAEIDTPVDVIVSDLWMPGMDGMAFMRALGASGARASVILTSALDADAREMVAREARDAGVQLLGAVDKPVTAAKLSALLPRRA